GVARRVDQVDLAALTLEMRERSGERHLPALLVLVPVADRRSRFDGAETVDRACLEEHRLEEGGLTRPAMSDDGDVADLPGLLHQLLLGTHVYGSRPILVGACESSDGVGRRGEPALYRTFQAGNADGRAGWRPCVLARRR